MKKYLVACNLGADVIESYVVEVAKGYIPSSDDMKMLRDKVVEKYKPRVYVKYSIPGDNGGEVRVRENGNGQASYWKSKDLKILAVSNLDL